MRKFGLLALAVSLFSTATLGSGASAADLPIKAPAGVVAAPSGWTGFYIGGNVGGGWDDRDFSITPNDPAAAPFLNAFGVAGPGSFRTSGVIAGLQLGYNWQFSPNWLIGIEADFDWSNISGSTTSSQSGFAGPPLPTGWRLDEHIKWFGTVRGRLGWLPWQNLLVYGTGGFAYGRVEDSGSVTDTGAVGYLSVVVPFSVTCAPGAVCFSGSSHNNLTGWTAGGGLEYALWQHWSIKAEYLYVSLASKSLTETAPTVLVAGQTPASFNVNYSHTDFHVARLGLNYRF